MAPDDATTVDLTAPENSPERKRTKNTNVPSLIKEINGYTTKSFSMMGVGVCFFIAQEPCEPVYLFVVQELCKPERW